MLWERARLEPGQTVLIHGATGAVGGYAVPMAKNKGVRVLATVRAGRRQALAALGVDGEVDLAAGASPAKAVDAALDLVGGASQAELFRCIKPGGALISAVSPPDAALARAHGVRTDFFIVEVDTARLDALSDLIRQGVVRPVVGAVLPLAEAKQAHELMEGPAHPAGKIVLQVASVASGRANA
jgi:NADPH:quinone reductase-like Zn-dependent oxidoreductase